MPNTNGDGHCDCPTITAGTTTTLPAGSQATVTNSGTDTELVLDFGIPAGPQGPAGEDATIDIGDLISQDEGNIIKLGSDGKLYAACCGGDEGISHKHIRIDVVGDIDEDTGSVVLDFTKALNYTIDGILDTVVSIVDNDMEAFTAKIFFLSDEVTYDITWPSNLFWATPVPTQREEFKEYVVEIVKFGDVFIASCNVRSWQ